MTNIDSYMQVEVCEKMDEYARKLIKYVAVLSSRNIIISYIKID